MKKTLRKERRQTLKKSMGRFISIFSLIALGVFVFVGLKITGPDMRLTAEEFYKKNNLADINITSTIGLNESDRRVIEEFDDLHSYEYGYIKDVAEKDSDNSFKILSKPNLLSKYEVVSGDLPEKDYQIALDYRLKDYYKLGEEIEFEKVDEGQTKLKKSTFTVVGFVKSSEYIDNHRIGETNVGTGNLTGYGVVTKEAFDSNNYSVARLRFKDTRFLSPYSDEYKSNVEKHIDDIEEVLKGREENKLKVYKDDNFKKIDDKLADISNKKSILSNNKDSKEYKDLVEAEKKLKYERGALESISTPVYNISDREKNPGYSVYRENSERIDILSNVFPVFMFAVAALVSLTTMTRFVEEERKNMGLLKSLGYKNKDIYMKFVNYGLFASIGGAVLGCSLGYTFLPREIFKAYAATSTISDFVIQFSVKYTLIALVIAVMCTVLSAYLVAKKELGEKPSELFMPKSPKAGSRILLERIGFIWSRMSFSKKVTARNIFRYKQRMFMTIFGVAGCTALLVMGFGIKDSLSGLVDRQYSQIIKYDLIEVDNKNNQADKEELENYLKSDDVDVYKTVHYEVLSKKINGVKQEISLIVPENLKYLDYFFKLNNVGAKKSIFEEADTELDLEDDGVVITKKLAKLLNLGVGETIEVKDENEKSISMKVSGITEMYMGHYIFSSKDEYKKIFKKDADINARLINSKERDNEKIDEVSSDLVKLDAVSGVIQNTSLKQKINSIIKGLDNVIVILIICAILLAFVVIYNLTNINVSERIRELSTIKVLGFYDKEVTDYIYRETIILSAIGIVIGFVLGFCLHRFIMTSLPPDDAMFYPNMKITNFLLSTVITMVITIFISIVMHRKIKKVDMLEALKSLE